MAAMYKKVIEVDNKYLFDFIAFIAFTIFLVITLFVFTKQTDACNNMIQLNILSIVIGIIIAGCVTTGVEYFNNRKVRYVKVRS